MKQTLKLMVEAAGEQDKLGALFGELRSLVANPPPLTLSRSFYSKLRAILEKFARDIDREQLNDEVLPYLKQVTDRMPLELLGITDIELRSVPSSITLTNTLPLFPYVLCRSFLMENQITHFTTSRDKNDFYEVGEIEINTLKIMNLVPSPSPLTYEIRSDYTMYQRGLFEFINKLKAGEVMVKLNTTGGWMGMLDQAKMSLDKITTADTIHIGLKSRRAALPDEEDRRAALERIVSLYDANRNRLGDLAIEGRNRLDEQEPWSDAQVRLLSDMMAQRGRHTYMVEGDVIITRDPM
jgi:hypothetical protein